MTERMRWAKQIITLTTTAGPTSVEANVYGDWAVHAPIQTSRALYFHWGVSHVPTGLLVGYGFPKDRARKLCQQLHRIVGDTPITGEGMPGISDEMRRQIYSAIRVASGADPLTEAPLSAGATT